MGNKLKQCIPFVMISIPFVFWYLGVITGQETYSFKLTTVGFISFFHIILSVMLYFAKKDHENNLL